MSAGRCLLAFLGYEVAFLQAVHAIYPYDVTPVTNIIATTTRWDKQLPLMVDLMRAAVALFFRFVRVVVSYCTKLVMEARRRA
jgi:hypothetical protein